MKKILCVLLTILLSLNGLAAYAQEPAPTQRTLQSGSRGDDVLTMKRRLRELNYFSTDDLNDRFNQSTEKAVKQFQKENGLKQTGKVDGKLWALLFSDQAAAHADPTPTPKPTPKPTKAPPAATPYSTAGRFCSATPSSARRTYRALSGGSLTARAAEDSAASASPPKNAGTP